MLSIRVLIIGGNVGGLASAISFRRAGHEVIVFETRNSVAPVRRQPKYQFSLVLTRRMFINRRSLVVLDCHLISPRFYIIGVMRDDFEKWHLNQQLLISDCVSMICIVFFFDHR